MPERVPASLPYIPEPAEARRLGLAPLICLGLAVIAVFFGGVGTWSSFAELDSAALAPGGVGVGSRRKTVKHLEGGIVSEILVTEGQHVAAGDVLVRLDPTQARAKLDQLEPALIPAEGRRARPR